MNKMVLGNGVTLHYRIEGEAEARSLESGRVEREGTHGLSIYDASDHPVRIAGRILNWSVVGFTGEVIDGDVVV